MSKLSETTENICHYETFMPDRAIFWKRTELICTPNNKMANREDRLSKSFYDFIISKIVILYYGV